MDMQKETIFSESETANSKQLAVLKANFPQCFDKNGAFIQEKLLEIVKSADVELSKESYSLNWLGKSYARLLANLPPKTLLAEDKNHNQRVENKNSQNLLIKGDNLEVLKHMVNAYAEKVKMIYIDPPYNTGSDGFAYNDDRKFTPEELSELAGIDLDEATRILDFTVKGSSSHSAWLTFIYPRLYIARELLQEDGLIFISIDDNEASQLKILCDEIFGEYNFVDPIIWKKRYGGGAKEKHLVALHEYIIVYCKNKSLLDDLFIPLNEDNIDKYYKNKDEHFDKRGPYRTHPLEAMKSFDARENLNFPIIAPDESDVWPKRQWRWSKERVEQALKVNEIEFSKTKDGWSLSSKQYLKDENGIMRKTKPFNVIDDVYTQHGTNEIVKMLGNSKVFDFPKPTLLLKKLIAIALNSSTNEIVLDFFGGSGSTGHAVFEYNLEYQSKIKFILIQINELTDSKSDAYKEGFKSIFDITKKRVSIASENIRREKTNYNGDIGFKIFETIDDFRVKNDSELTLSNHTFFDDVVLTPEQYDTLLTTWCLYDGSLLTTPIEDVDLNGYKAHLCDGRLYLIAPNFTSEALKALLQKLDSDKDFAPNKVVFYGSNFESAKQMELNEALKSYANKKSIDLDLVVRN
ncbi:TPA: site-specific DNA-methyltransferase [Raoultella planticola]|uniref:site-specific DNA-methyltransferase n=1 Tax=Enterobacteriaceae TaxID=543 RepID=UPI0003AB05DF|nr:MULTISPECIES: site-specific DNA-methyltransferase [Enterobacteriaceae]ECY6499410.1 site-specific DNA-methyltransferase [Salmonella enterica subsp. enterica serovar Infantis]